MNITTANLVLANAKANTPYLVFSVLSAATYNQYAKEVVALCSSIEDLVSIKEHYEVIEAYKTVSRSLVTR